MTAVSTGPRRILHSLRVAVVASLLVAGAAPQCPAQRAGGAEITDTRAPSPPDSQLETERIIEEFRSVYAELGRPRITLSVERTDPARSSARPLSVEDRSGSRDLERAVTRMLRLGGATLADPRASGASSQGRSSGTQEASAREWSLVMSVDTAGKGSVRLTLSRKTDGSALASATSDGSTASHAEQAVLLLMSRLAESR